MFFCLDTETNDCQIIVATQSPLVIDSAYKDEIRFLTRDNEGYVKAEIASVTLSAEQ